MKLYALLSHMSYAVDAIAGARSGALADGAKLPVADPLRGRLQQFADQADALRSKIVATKEGGMITGEERIREHVGALYGDVNGWEGRPADYQVARTASLTREMDEVLADFKKLTDKELPTLNPALTKKKLAPIAVLSEADWQKTHSGGGASGPSSNMREREVD
jgi:hypothetical protein